MRNERNFMWSGFLQKLGILAVGVLTILIMPSFVSASFTFPISSYVIDDNGATRIYADNDGNYEFSGTGNVRYLYDSGDHTYASFGTGATTTAWRSGNVLDFINQQGVTPLNTKGTLIMAVTPVGCSVNLPGTPNIEFTGCTEYLIAQVEDGVYTPTFDDSTRFITVTPPGSSYVATGTNSIGFTAYINSDDFSDGSDYFSFIITPLDAVNPIDAEALIFSGAVGDDFMFATTSGMFYFSTTTNFQLLGNYRVDMRFYGANCGIFGFTPGFCYQQIVASSSSFVVATTSAFRNISRQIDNSIRDAIASTTLQISQVCTPFSSTFDIVPCFVSLIVPSSEVIEADIVLLRSLPPWGYVFRFYDIITDDNLVALPEANFPIPGTSQTLNITPWNHLFGTTSLIASGEAKMTLNGVEYGNGESFRELFEPVWKWLWIMVLGFSIIRKLIGTPHVSEMNSHGGVGNKPYGPEKP